MVTEKNVWYLRPKMNLKFNWKWYLHEFQWFKIFIVTKNIKTTDKSKEKDECNVLMI